MKLDEECAVLLQQRSFQEFCLLCYFLQNTHICLKTDKSRTKADLNTRREMDWSSEPRGACDGAHRMDLKYQKSDHQTETQISV